MKSFLNDELIVTADQIAQEIDSLHTHTWLAPLLMMKRVLENEDLGSSEKLSILTNIRDVADIVSLQVSIEGSSSPILITQDKFTARLVSAGVSDPSALLSLTPEQISDIQNMEKMDRSLVLMWKRDGIFNQGPEYIPEIDCRLLSIVIPLKEIAGRKAVLSSKINLKRVRETMERHPFHKNGNIMLINRLGDSLFHLSRSDVRDYEIVKATRELLNAGIGTTGVAPYVRPSGKKMLAGYTFPSNFDWVVIVEKDESKAYLAVSKMVENLFMMALTGLVIAVAGAILFSNRIGRPILEIGSIAQRVGRGDFTARVRPRRSRDEISELGERINEMIEGLYERLQLQKFVSDQTIHAIKQADDGIRLGGERRTATVLFSDIRGFTAFSERYEPETVIKMLNTYLRSQAQIVRVHNGDIDKYVGDELIAVFQEHDMAENAVRCSVEIHQAIERLNEVYPEWCIRVGIGINTGEMIMGAMGSEERMDYTILGKHVNLASRLCSHAGPGETILSESTYHHIRHPDSLNITKEDPIQVKGKSGWVQICKVKFET